MIYNLTKDFGSASYEQSKALTRDADISKRVDAVNDNSGGNYFIEENEQNGKSKFNLDGTLKEKQTFVEKQEDIEKSLGKKAVEESSATLDVNKNLKEHAQKKHDGFDEDCPACECETCRNRRYKDGSDDSAVSFQTPTKMDPNKASHLVRKHENEHVRREQYKAQEEGRKVISQSVTILSRNCPECGTRYTAGGLTRTKTTSAPVSYGEILLAGNDEEKLNDIGKKMDCTA